MLIFSKKEVELGSAKSKEYLLANGLGGYSSSTIIGMNTRKYHGLLVSSMDNTPERYIFLSKFEEELLVDNKSFSLSTNEYPNAIHPSGYKFMESFVYNIFPTFNFKVDNIEVSKSIVVPHMHNAIIVSYKINSDRACKLKIRPFVNSRKIHSLTKDTSVNFSQSVNKNNVVIKPSNIQAAIILGSDKASYFEDSNWYFKMEYEQEFQRGYDFRENIFCPGYFIFDIRKGLNKVNFLCVADSEKEAYNNFDKLYSIDSKDYESYFVSEVNRIRSLIKQTYNFNGIKENYLLPYLIQASDSFIIKKNNQANIISGYPWFSEYGRDALISLPGLCLCTSRSEDAKEILVNYAKNCKNGLIPSLIKEDGIIEYNSVDSSLWFIYSVFKFYQYTKNLYFIKENFWSVIKEIITNYFRGTEGVKADSDFLISVSSNSPMTWMDTRNTLRNGKAVEVNALWFNALKIFDFFCMQFNETTSKYYNVSEIVRAYFNEEFWNHGEKCLYDVVTNGVPDISIRPNQLLAVALPFSLLNKKKELMVLKKVTEELLTPYGLRSLSYKDQRFISRYEGGESFRDKAYHNGTVWPYLLGFYITSYMKVHNHSLRAQQEMHEKILKLQIYNLKNAGIGTNSEIFDGEYPFAPKGCISQAWSVAEIIRAYLEDVLKK